MFVLDRRRLGVVLAVTAAAALIGVAARGDHRRRSTFGIPETVSTTTQAMLLILFAVFAAGVLVLTVWAFAPDDLPTAFDRRRRTRSLVGTLVGLVLLLTFFSWASRNGGDEADDGAPASIDAPALPAPEGGVVEDRPGPSWGLGLVGVALLLVAAAAVAHRRRVAPLDLPDGPRPAIATEETRHEAVRAAEACTDPRQAVLLAFAAAEALLSTDAATRRPPATSAREWATALGLAPLTIVVGRYEVARFSHHDVGDADREQALAALRALA